MVACAYVNNDGVSRKVSICTHYGVVVDVIVGFLASTEEEYAQAMALAISGTARHAVEPDAALASCLDRMRCRARDASHRFSDELFSAQFGEVLQTYLN